MDRVGSRGLDRRLGDLYKIYLVSYTGTSEIERLGGEEGRVFRYECGCIYPIVNGRDISV